MGKWYGIAARKHCGENQPGRCDKESTHPFQDLNSPLHDLNSYCNGEVGRGWRDRGI